MSDESASTIARARPTPYRVWQRVLVWWAGTVLGSGVAALQIRFVPSLGDLRRTLSRDEFQFHHYWLLAFWLASAALVDKPKFLGWAFPAFFAWLWLWFATVIEGMGV